MAEQFVNFTVMHLAVGCLIGDLTVTVDSAFGLPAIGTWRILIDNEIMLVTSRAGVVLTVTRGTEGTAASGHAFGQQVAVIDTAEQGRQLKYDAATLLPYEMTLVAGAFGSGSGAFAAVGGRAVDFTKFPATLGTLARTVTFAVTILQTAGAAQANIRLYNVEDGAAITSSGLNNSAAASPNLPFDVSAVVPVGLIVGDMRSDVIDHYEVQLQMSGGVIGVDSAICTNARLLITYV